MVWADREGTANLQWMVVIRMQGGFCSADQAGTGCADQQWSDACCLTAGFNCLRFSASYWECRSVDSPHALSVENL
jgi:hypothetical protein